MARYLYSLWFTSSDGRRAVTEDFNGALIVEMARARVDAGCTDVSIAVRSFE